MPQGEFLTDTLSLTVNSRTGGIIPAINVLASVSRVMKDVVDKKHLEAAYKFRELLAAYTDAEDLINLGGYVRGCKSCR